MPDSVSIPNLPWQERPAGSSAVVWRYDQNPVIPRSPFPGANSTFNSAIIPYQNEFAGVFRIDDTRRVMNLYLGFSQDGLNWDIQSSPIHFQCQDSDIGSFLFRYDPRLCWLEDRYYLTWCNGYHGPTIGVGYTFDFETFTQIENAYLPFNRNGVLFPRKIKGKYAMLSRPSDNGHTPFGDIFYSESPDMIHWGRHRHVMSSDLNWAYTKVGAGPIPIETSEGWLLIFHGVLTSCNGFVYSMGAALLDLDQPWKIIARAEPYLLSPQALYECVGDVPNVVFPCAALVDGDTGRMAIYYGAADTVVALAFARVDELIQFIKTNGK
ncbi:glycoside hydrolase family 130 protein [Sedimenticola sp.]|uniref:glycoside hydrolase family 130 protein n=1 Tax=Sedimenticola sp. TaxID=1940285 RepID=UPI003D0D914C